MRLSGFQGKQLETCALPMPSVLAFRFSLLATPLSGGDNVKSVDAEGENIPSETPPVSAAGGGGSEQTRKEGYDEGEVQCAQISNICVELVTTRCVVHSK